jgi:hypothetical protein
VLRYAPENRSRPRALTGKWLLKNEKQDSNIKPGPFTN